MASKDDLVRIESPEPANASANRVKLSSALDLPGMGIRGSSGNFGI